MILVICHFVGKGKKDSHAASLLMVIKNTLLAGDLFVYFKLFDNLNKPK